MTRWLGLAAAAAFVFVCAGCGGPDKESASPGPGPKGPAKETKGVPEPGLAPATPPPVEKSPAEKLPVAAPKTPEAAANPDKTGPVVAVVDGETVTRGELDAFIKKANVPEESRASVEREALDELIKRQLLQKFLATQKIELDPEVLFNARLHSYLQQMTGGPKDDAAALALAASIKKELDGGADFAALAKRHSSCPSAEQGGDLGDFAPARMVPAFTAAVNTLKVNGISEPVKTQFGYHVIQRLAVEDAATKEPGMLHARHILVTVENAGNQQAIQRRYGKLVDELRAKAKIEVKLPEAAPEPPELPMPSQKPAPKGGPR